MKVLVTGGGFLGQRLAHALQAGGHAVCVLDVAPAPSPDLDWQRGDVSLLDDVVRAPGTWRPISAIKSSIETITPGMSKTKAPAWRGASAAANARTTSST